MDFAFPKPVLEARRILNKVQRGEKTQQELVEYLEKEEMKCLLRQYARKGYIEEHNDRSMQIDQDLEEKTEDELREIGEQLSKEVDYDSFLLVVQRLCNINKALALRFDAYTAEIRMLLLLERNREAEQVLKNTDKLTELGLDWGRRNKFKTYKGLFCMQREAYREASELFLDALSTFEGEELITYKELVHYTIFCGMLVLPRQEISKRLIESSEVCEVVKDIDGAHELMVSFYECNYTCFFENLVRFASTLAQDVNTKPRADYFVYLMKVRAYGQLFMSYKAISLEQMADIFRVRPEYIIKDIEAMILREDLSCKINHQSMMIYNNAKPIANAMEVQEDTLSHIIQKMIK